MKRFLASALILGSFSTFALVGCDDTSKSSVKVEESTPDGKRTTEVEKKVTESGTPPATGTATDAPK